MISVDLLHTGLIDLIAIFSSFTKYLLISVLLCGSQQTEKLEFFNRNHSHGETLNRFPLWSQPPPFRSSPCCHGNNCSYRRCVVGHSGIKNGKLVQ